MIRLICACSLIALSACVTVVAEQEGRFTYKNETFRTVTRTYQRDDGSTYKRRTIYLRAERVTCSATDNLDCAVALSDLAARARSTR